MPRLLKDSGDSIGEVSEEQLQFLTEHLVAEEEEDRDYYITKDTLEMLEEDGCDGALLTLLKNALGDNEDMDLRWER
jgi:processive 1,2-diacylglycerol beta-glucosyltransferase